MGKRETQFIKKIAPGLGITIYESEGSGGPGRSYRRGMSQASLHKTFPDDDSASEVVRIRDMVGRPGAPAMQVRRRRGAAHPQRPAVPVRRMRGRFGVGVGTVMERTKLGYRDWAEAIYHMMTNAKGVSGMKVHRDLGIVQPAAWFLVQRLRDDMIPMAGSDAMEGPAEADEACIDGREKNKHPNKKGKAKKAAVVGVRDRKTGHVAAGPAPETTGARLCHFVESRVNPDATVYADEGRAYSDIERRETANHGDGGYARGDVRTSGMLPRSVRIESFRVILRRGYYGTFHCTV